MKKITVFIGISCLMLMTNAALAGSYGFHPGGGSKYSSNASYGPGPSEYSYREYNYSANSDYGSRSTTKTKASWGPKKNVRYKSSSGSQASKGFGGSMPASIGASGGKQFVFNPRIHMWAVYDGSGTRVRQGVANGGANYCHDVKRRCHTPVGTYRILSKGGAGCKSSKYPLRKNGKSGGAPMPYCMFFNTNFSIHGHAGLVNANVSHGCVRVSNEAAQWLQGYLPIGSRVTIQSY